MQYKIVPPAGDLTIFIYDLKDEVQTSDVSSQMSYKSLPGTNSIFLVHWLIVKYWVGYVGLFNELTYMFTPMDNRNICQI